MDIGSRGIILEQKHLFNQWQMDLWYITRNKKEIQWRKVTASIQCGKWIRYRETTGGGTIQITTKGESGTQHINASCCQIQNSIIRLCNETKLQMVVVLVQKMGAGTSFYTQPLNIRCKVGFGLQIKIPLGGA